MPSRRARRCRRDTGALSTSLHKVNLSPSWKQEVNRRVAAHLSRKTAPAGEAEPHTESRLAADSRAAQAAARVAARYANAPSYNEMLADEARVVVRAAQAASRAAQEAQAAAQYVLDGLESAAAAEPAPEPVWKPKPKPVAISKRKSALAAAPAQVSAETRYFEQSPLFASHWEPLGEPAETAQLGAMSRGPGITEVHTEQVNDLELPAHPDAAEPHSSIWDSGVWDSEHQWSGDPAQPIYANLIEFPRPMVATRKVRPRLAEGPLAQVESAPQLSIFEVDPATVSSEPAPAAVDEPSAPAWMVPQWPAMEPAEENWEEILEEPAPRASAAVEPAPVGRRLMALVVDCSLIAASFLAVAMLAASHMSELPSPRLAEQFTGIAMLAIGVAYLVFFFALARATPGMWYAGIQLSTLAGRRPSRQQRCARLLALPLSVLPLGLGLAWALFDDAHLAWHDRLSRTYLRKR